MSIYKINTTLTSEQDKVNQKPYNATTKNIRFENGWVGESSSKVYGSSYLIVFLFLKGLMDSVNTSWPKQSKIDVHS